MDNVLFGTAGWTDPSLIASKRFYPPGTSSSSKRLAFYASQFPVVEVDATYYAIPSAQTTSRWCEDTPEWFVFDIKAHPVFTGHPIDVRRLPKQLREELDTVLQEPRIRPERLPRGVVETLERDFLACLEPIQRAGKLGCVMVQLPPWTEATRGAVRKLEAVTERLSGIPVAVEFRHPSWLHPERRRRVFEMLAANGLAYVAVDEPNVRGGGVPPVVTATDRALAVVRMHGRNRHGWREGASVAERFDYLYEPRELAPWVPSIRRLADTVEKVHVVFNNCVQDFAVVNAKDMAALLAWEGENQRSRAE